MTFYHNRTCAAPIRASHSFSALPSSAVPLSFLSDETWLGLFWHSCSELQYYLWAGEVKQTRSCTLVLRFVVMLIAGVSLGCVSSLQGEHGSPALLTFQLQSRKVVLQGGRGKDAFTRCVSAMSLRNLSHHS